VADLVWRNTRHEDESNHFADMDLPGKGGRSLLDLCEDPVNVDPDVWNDYYDGIGEDRRGALPIRVWEIYEQMTDFAAADKLIDFVCAGGIMAHYVGDACQPLHISQFHHGRDPADPKRSKVHSVYETRMIADHGDELIGLIAKARTPAVAEIAPAGRQPSGHDAAVAVVQLMRRTVADLPPLTIVKVFDEHMGRGQTEAMWRELKEATARRMQDGAKTLARIWEAAWRAGRAGKPDPRARPAAFAHSDLEALYNDPAFLRSRRLQDLTTNGSGKIVPKARPPARRPRAGPARSAELSGTPLPLAGEAESRQRPGEGA
jgi:hypothetical protein